MGERLDCVIIGYNELDFQRVAANARTIERQSPIYSELQRSSARYKGRRLPYMDLLNAALEDATGHAPHLNVGRLPNLGVAYLASFLRRRGYAVEFVNFYNHQLDHLADLLAERPRAVAITTTFYVNNDPIADICGFVRDKSPDSRIIVGGPHIYNICKSVDVPTADLILRPIGADIFVYESQGEATLAHVVAALRDGDPPDLRSIPNLLYSLDGGPFTATERLVENNDLDANVVDWSLFGSDFYTPTVQLRTARSCAFECAFCRYPAVAGPLTLNSVEVLEGELRKLRAAGVENVVFIDDTFNVPLPRYKNICRMLIRNQFGFKWFSYFRCSNSDPEAFDLMAEAGCKGTFLGIESGDQTVLNAMNKSAKIERYLHGIRRLKALGITTYASFIVGFPTESEDTIRNTRAFIEEAAPDFISAGMWYFDDKTPIAGMAEKYGLKGDGFHWRHATMDWKEAREHASGLYRSVAGTTIMPTYSFDFWSLPYLLGQGFTVDQVKGFCRIAQETMVKGLEHDDYGSEEQDRRLRDYLVNGGAPDRFRPPPA